MNRRRLAAPGLAFGGADASSLSTGTCVAGYRAPGLFSWDPALHAWAPINSLPRLSLHWEERMSYHGHGRLGDVCDALKSSRKVDCSLHLVELHAQDVVNHCLNIRPLFL